MDVVHLAVLIGAALAIYLASEWFVNAVEWAGSRLSFGTVAVGSILAAAGTALPESIVTLVAVTIATGPGAKEIGVGAAMGGPLVLATVGYGVTGLLFGRARRALRSHPLQGVDLNRLAQDQFWFLTIFVVKVGLGLVIFAIKPVLGLIFFAAYAVYVWRETRREDDAHDEDGLEALFLHRHRERPANWAIALQLLGALAVVFVASQLFVDQLSWAGPKMGISPALTALFLSPVATELPEMMNVFIWMRQGKTQLALANISGAMMIQATVPSGIGILFTPWHFDAVLILSGAVTMAAIVYLLVLLRLGKMNRLTLSIVAALYLVFVAGALALR